MSKEPESIMDIINQSLAQAESSLNYSKEEFAASELNLVIHKERFNTLSTLKKEIEKFYDIQKKETKK